MILMVPTFMVKVMSAMQFDTPNGPIKVGDILDVSYGQGLIMKAAGAASGFVDEEATHIKGQEQLKQYGADCFFPQRNQTCGRIAEYLAAQGYVSDRVN